MKRRSTIAGVMLAAAWCTGTARAQEAAAQAPEPATTRPGAAAASAPAASPTPQPEPAQPSSKTGDLFGTSDKTKVAVMDLRGAGAIPPDFMTTLTSLVPQTLQDLGPFAAISGQEIDQMLELQQLKEQLGCTDVDMCLAEIGGALGADYLISGRLTLVADTYLLQMQLIDIGAARADARVEREYRGGPRGLLTEVRTATKILVRDLLKQRSGTLALAVSEEGATVAVDSSIVGTSPVPPLSLSGGMHTLTVEKRGFVVYARDVEIAANQQSDLEVQLLPSAAFLEDYRERTGFVRSMAYVSMGVGVVGVASAVGLWFLGESWAQGLREKIDRFEIAGASDVDAYEEIRDLDRQLGTLDAVTLLAAGVGVTGLAVGGLMFALGEDPDRYDELMWGATEEAEAAP